MFNSERAGLLLEKLQIPVLTLRTCNDQPGLAIGDLRESFDQKIRALARDQPSQEQNHGLVIGNTCGPAKRAARRKRRKVLAINPVISNQDLLRGEPLSDQLLTFLPRCCNQSGRISEVIAPQELLPHTFQPEAPVNRACHSKRFNNVRGLPSPAEPPDRRAQQVVEAIDMNNIELSQSFAAEADHTGVQR